MHNSTLTAVRQVFSFAAHKRKLRAIQLLLHHHRLVSEPLKLRVAQCKNFTVAMYFHLYSSTHILYVLGYLSKIVCYDNSHI